MDAEKRINDALQMGRRAGAYDASERLTLAEVYASVATAEAVLELVGAVQALERTIKEVAGVR